MNRFKELIDYYRWRVTLLQCKWSHQWVNSYTRISMDGHYSGKVECKRCFEHKYFSGKFR